MSISVGQVLLGQFRVDDFIGSGGMGVVYRVWDLKRNVPLAMKVLHSDLADDPSVLKRFRREARALRKLAHPHIVPFYGLHQADGVAFLLERFIDGPSLKELLRRRRGKPVSAREMLVYLKATSSALGYAHAHGVVHCDVKPGNVMVNRGGGIFLTDFGVARHADSTTTTLGVAGTAAYMAPEQCRADPVSPATDVYALGVVLFELTTGRRPFVGDEEGTEASGSTEAERVRFAHVHLAPPDPLRANPKLGRPLADVILHALAKEPTQRYGTTMELYQAAAGALGAAPERVEDRAAVPASIAGHYAVTSPPVAQGGASRLTYRWTDRFSSVLRGRDKWRFLIAGAVALLFLVGLFAFAGRNSGDGQLNLDTNSREVGAAAVETMPASSRVQSELTPTVRPTQNLVATSAAKTVVAEITQSAIQVTPIPGSTWRPFTECPASRIRIGNWTRVSLYPPLANRVRDAPGIGVGTVIGRAEPGTPLLVLAGPECVGNMIWWLVRSQDRTVEGWTAEGEAGEFWLDPGSLALP